MGAAIAGNVRQLNIRTGVLVILAAVAITAAGVNAGIRYTTARDALEEQSFQRLTAVHDDSTLRSGGAPWSRRAAPLSHPSTTGVKGL